MTDTRKALEMAIEAMSCISQSRGDPLLKAIRACKEALEHQEVGDAEIKQMLDDIEYYKNRLAKYEDVL